MHLYREEADILHTQEQELKQSVRRLEGGLERKQAECVQLQAELSSAKAGHAALRSGPLAQLQQEKEQLIAQIHGEREAFLQQLHRTKEGLQGEHQVMRASAVWVIVA